METRIGTRAGIVTVIIVVLALTPSTRLAAQNGPARGHHHYKLIKPEW